MSEPRKIVILGTGGTIAGQGEAEGGGVAYKAAQIGVAQLLSASLGANAWQGYVFETQQVAQLDSKDMDFATWFTLAQACAAWLSQPEVAALVVTHGTDTIEETAWFLQCVLQPSKPVVLTCAMRPATALSPDGPANLRDAICVAADGAAGVWVAAAGEVHAAMHVRKVHPYRLHAFSSDLAGAAAWVEEGRVRWSGGPAVPSRQRPALQLPPAQAWPWVEVVASVAGANGRVVDSLVAAGVRGIVLAGTGNGSIHQSLQEAIFRAHAAGVVVWRATRCELGQVVGAPGHCDALATALHPLKARISLMLQLMGKECNGGG